MKNLKLSQKVSDNKLRHLFKRNRVIALTGIIFVLVLAGSYLINKNQDTDIVANSNADKLLAQIVQSSDSEEQADKYLELIKMVGPVEAQEMLVRSGLPFTGATHLINHTIGTYLFDTHGIEGISYCRDYFLGSCYHGLLLNVIQGSAEKDKTDIEMIVKHCTDAGPGVLTQCMHGVGHGYVPAVGYKNLFTALEQCDKLSESVKGFLQYNCLDGAFMENIWGAHSGEPSADRLVKANDPLYPCNDPRMKPQYINPCWSNQPALIYQQKGGDLASVSDICLQVTPDDAKETCFNGLARQIHPITENKTDKVFTLCDEIDSAWREYCYLTNSGAAFSVGDRTMPFEVCDRLSPSKKQECNSTLVSSILYFSKSKDEATDWCERIKDASSRERTNCLSGAESKQ